jgi:IMP dehydrogenase
VGTTLPEAQAILHQHRIEKLPLVDENGRLMGLITVKDIRKKIDYPNVVTDDGGRLLAAAAIGVGDKGLQRLEQLARAQVDVVVIDTAHGHTALVLETITAAKKRYPHLAVIGGNAATAAGTRDIINAGADAVKVGIGAGSICTTRIVAGAGIPQLTAVMECANESHKHNIPCIADGGIKYSGDIVKALAAGADVVMLGSMLAGLEESPGDILLYEGRRYKIYRGMGSLGAMQGHGADRYASAVKKYGERKKLVPEGVEGQVPYRGKLDDIIYQMMGGLRSGMGYAGAANLEELRENSRFVQITNAGLLESHPHGITITNEAPNYQARR